ncbi:MAG: dihydrofolate reductase [Bacteroidaceae bacterium]|nr:dihydrofolate reductase [Bacteroidaceae bacterium]
MISRKLLTIMITTSSMLAVKAGTDNFPYADERFADLQMLRYQVHGFDNLSLQQKKFVYYLSEAALTGRDILWDQNGRYNLRLRQMLETVYTDYQGDRTSADFRAFEVYLKRVWFSNGIHHHYGCDKFVPGFSEDFLRMALNSVDQSKLPLAEGQTVEQMVAELFPVIFDPTVMPKRTNQADGQDLVLTSAANYYGEGVTQAEAETFYLNMKEANPDPAHPVMFGMNSRLVKDANGKLVENVWRSGGLYGAAIDRIIHWLELAQGVAENDKQSAVIGKLIEYYRTGNLHTFDDYTILWVQATEGMVDFVNGFTESYGDPLGMKASWEGMANFKDLEATRRTETLSGNAQWFEDNSPVDSRFKKEECKGITAKVIVAAMLGGDLYPSTAIGINLPNSNWVRAEHGSKSVTIGNLTDAYNKAAHGNGFQEEFVIDAATLAIIRQYADACDDLHTDLHECLGHGSGKLLPGVDADSLKAYGSAIEEARADLFGLYYVADPKLVELGLTPNGEAYKSQYYTYMMNGLMTQLVRIEQGAEIEEAHMRNRALIAHWTLAHASLEAQQQGTKPAVELIKREGKTYVQINDYAALRRLFGQLLAEIQRVKSEGDFEGARQLIETYAVKIDPQLHAEVLERYSALNLAPYKGFINPVYVVERDSAGEITDIKVTYGETYADQMLRYSRDYRTLPVVNE